MSRPGRARSHCRNGSLLVQRTYLGYESITTGDTEITNCKYLKILFQYCQTSLLAVIDKQLPIARRTNLMEGRRLSRLRMPFWSIGQDFTSSKIFTSRYRQDAASSSSYLFLGLPAVLCPVRLLLSDLFGQLNLTFFPCSFDRCL